MEFSASMLHYSRTSTANVAAMNVNQAMMRTTYLRQHYVSALSNKGKVLAAMNVNQPMIRTTHVHRIPRHSGAQTKSFAAMNVNQA